MSSLNVTLTSTEDGVGCSYDVPAQEPSVSCACYPRFLSLLQDGISARATSMKFAVLFYLRS